MLYLYHAQSLSPEAWQGFVKTLQEQEEKAVLWNDKDLGHKVDDLLAQGRERSQGPDDLASSGKEMPGLPFLLMDVPGEALQGLVTSLRQNGCYIPHKATVTDRNQTMTLEDLIRDVMEEHALMGQIQTLHKLLESSKDFSEGLYPVQAWADFQALREEAQGFLNQVGKREISLQEAGDMVKKYTEGSVYLIKQGGGGRV